MIGRLNSVNTRTFSAEGPQQPNSGVIRNASSTIQLLEKYYCCDSDQSLPRAIFLAQNVEAQTRIVFCDSHSQADIRVPLTNEASHECQRNQFASKGVRLEAFDIGTNDITDVHDPENVSCRLDLLSA